VGCYPDKIKGSNDPSDIQTPNDTNITINNTINGKNKLDIFSKNNKSSTILSTNTKKSNNSTGDTSFDLDTTVITIANNTNTKNKTNTMASSNGTNNLNVNEEKKVFKTKETDSRKKIALGKGYSLMDWIRFTKETPDLAGNQGILRKITYEELAKHNKEDDCWLAIYGWILLNLFH
jgi:hypothetical protein